MNSLRKLLRSRSHSANPLTTRDFISLWAIASAVALCLFFPPASYAKDRAKAKATPASSGTTEKSEENHRDLIQKAQNLTLQQDRLQASQVLIRGIQRESRGSPAYRELVRALGELSTVFYSGKTQDLFATAESLVESKPREAVDGYLEALKLEDRNVSILKAIARAYLRLDECEKADARVKSAEDMDPYSAEIHLLRLQVHACQKSYEQLAARMSGKDGDMEIVEKSARGLQVLDAVHRRDLKRAKAIVAGWESQSPDYPEVHYWKWQLAQESGVADRVAAAKYEQLCQNLTPRKRKTFSLDVDLCSAKKKDMVSSFLREKDSIPSPTPGGSH